VELCEAVERTGAIYALAENYPYMLCNLELERLYKGGTLGQVLYAEGEYVHPMSPDDVKYLTPDPLHWRAWGPRTYYLTHSLAPLMMMTDTMPVAVNSKTVHSEYLDDMVYKTGLRKVSDAVSIMLLEMDNGALFRITGCAAFAPHGNWYRLACELGGAESIRGNQNLVRLEYNHWSTPEGVKTSETYQPEWPSNKELAEKAGHGGWRLLGAVSLY
jgi:predicted dehydrogenase